MSRKQSNFLKKTSKENIIFYNALFVSNKVERVEPETTNKHYDRYRQQWTECVLKSLFINALSDKHI
jgi:hypothetical protein